MSKLDTGEIQKENISVVQHVVYRIPKRNHASMLRFCEEASEIFRESGGLLRHEVFQLNNTDVPLGGFLASPVSSQQRRMRKSGWNYFTSGTANT